MPKGINNVVKCKICGLEADRKFRHQRTCLRAACVSRNRWHKQNMKAYWRRKTENCLVCAAWLGIGRGRRTLCGKPECRAEQKRRNAKLNYVPHRELPQPRQEQRRQAALARYYETRRAEQSQNGAAA